MRVKEKFDKDKLFWTSDEHFHHKNIIEFCNRPFGDMQTMDSAMIQNWNRVVPKDGIVFELGDMIMTSSILWTEELLSKLNGTIYKVMGNHDYKNRMDREIIRDMFGGRVYDTLEVSVPDSELDSGCANFFMSHYPHLFWPSGYFHLHGHVHSGPNSEAKDKVPFHPRRYDVGVDAWNYTPVSYRQLMDVILKNNSK